MTWKKSILKIDSFQMPRIDEGLYTCTVLLKPF